VPCYIFPIITLVLSQEGLVVVLIVVKFWSKNSVLWAAFQCVGGPLVGRQEGHSVCKNLATLDTVTLFL